MRKVFTIAALLLACFTGMAQKAKTVTITGNVSGDTKGYNYVYYYRGGDPTDSVMIANGKFVVRVPYTETQTVALYTQYGKEVKRSYQTLVVLIDGSGDVQIDMDIESGLSEAKLSGSPTAVAYFNFRKQQSVVGQKVDDGINALYGKAFVPKGDPLYGRLMVSRDSLHKLYLGALASEFISAHKNEFLGVYILGNVGRSAYTIEKLDSTFKTLPANMQKTAEGEKIAAFLRGVKSTKIGASVKNFVLNDPEGKPVSFEQFKGKYVWIDFWASWCGPCKQAFPHMRELYAKYKDKGLEILGISTDSKIEPWLKILPILQNPWTQVWDNKNITSEFAVTAYPTSFLIDPNGVILLKEIGYNPNGDSPMDKKLEELFGAIGSTPKKVVPGAPMMKVN